MHPAEHLKNQKGILFGKRIVLCVTGSIAAVETVKLCRELLRNGADVFPVMSHAATSIIHPDSLWFACGRPPVVELSGAIEHVSLCGDVPDSADLLLVAPCTANTIGKMANGIDDTPVTTMATTALGTGISILVVPAMHGTMYDNPFVVENMKRLESAGVLFTPPVVEEGKAKMAPVTVVVEHVKKVLGPGTLEGKKVLVITGPTEEALDDMRSITNRSTGKMGCELAREAYRLGGDVLLFGGSRISQPPHFIQSMPFTSSSSLFDMVEGLEDGWDIVLVPAAISDYAPVPVEGKIPSGKDGLVVDMKPLPKLLPLLRTKTEILVAFKAESRVTREELEDRARRLLDTADVVVANNLEDVREENTRVLLIHKDGTREMFGSRLTVSREILEEVSRLV